jgi:hypothetical protein
MKNHLLIKAILSTDGFLMPEKGGEKEIFIPQL